MVAGPCQGETGLAQQTGPTKGSCAQPDPQGSALRYKVLGKMYGVLGILERMQRLFIFMQGLSVFEH